MRLEALIADRGDGVGLWPAVQAIVGDARDALQDLPVWERGFHIFWLLGPLILLIERTPADIWLSLIAVSFTIKSIVKRDGAWLKLFWFRAGVTFWLWCLISAALSSNPGYSLGEAAAWFRFPLFAIATVFWLGRDKRLTYAMLLSTAVGLLLMCGILAAELVIVGQQAGQLPPRRHTYAAQPAGHTGCRQSQCRRGAIIGRAARWLLHQRVSRSSPLTCS